ncbi:MAG: hypothetical protein L3J71_17710 [Victivallaceae bacterium]|nr:hypothetical protein [Victivallaceae bacterium]
MNNQTGNPKFHKGMLLFYCACVLVLLCAFGLMTFRIVLNSQLNAKLDEICAAGYPATLEELNDYYPAVPDDENAALLYEKAFGLYNSVDSEIIKQKLIKVKPIKHSENDLFDEETEQQRIAQTGIYRRTGLHDRYRFYL